MAASYAIQAHRDYWGGGEQPVQYSAGQQALGLGNFALGAGLIAGAGFLPIRGGKGRVWDYYLGAIKAVEEYSPGHIFRTFELSRMLDPLGSAARQSRFFSPEIVSELISTREGRSWVDYLSKLTGRNLLTEETFLSQGFRFEGERLLLGQTGDEVLLRHAGIIRNLTSVDPRFQTAYARSLFGGPWKMGRSAFSARIPFVSATGERVVEPFMFVGGQSRFQAAKRYISGYGTSLIERFNRLVSGDIPIVSSIHKRIPLLNKVSFGVTPSSGLKTFGKLALKLGVGLQALLLGYDQLDYFARRSELFDETIFGEGITAGFATMWTRGKVALSEVAERLGGHRYREWQEETAPGSTSLTRLAAFPIIGGLAGLGLGYAHRLFNQFSIQAARQVSSQEASLVYSAAQRFLVEKTLGREVETEFLRTLSPALREMAESRAGRWTGGYFGKALSLVGKALPGEKWGVGRLAGIGGAVLGALAVLPFVPGALVPSERPEELRQIYSGEKEVPIRRGRWWPMGRSSLEGGRPLAHVPHWYPRMLSRARDISIYGEEEISPIKKWYLQNFTYDIERAHYYDRPYPISTSAFSEVPMIGPLLGATIGEWVKPRRLMHAEDWMREGTGGTEYRRMPLGWGERLERPELGELPPGAPVSRGDIIQAVGEQAYYLQQIVGLPGFIWSSIKEAMTGTPGIADQEMRLAEAGSIYGYKREYWEQELGDPMGLCFVAGTKVETIEGPKNIEDIRIGEYVLNDRGFYKVVDKIARKPGSDRLLTIRSINGGAKFTCTENHWIPIFRRQRYSCGHTKPIRFSDIMEVQAKDIKKGDFLFYVLDNRNIDLVIDFSLFSKSFTGDSIYLRANQPRAMAWDLKLADPSLRRKDLRSHGIPDVIAKDVIRNFKLKKFPLRYRRYHKINEEFAYVIGWYIAEGSCDSGRVSFSMAASEQKQAECIAKILCEIHGASYQIKVKGNGLNLRVNDSVLARYFKDTFGGDAHTKKIPWEYKQLDVSILYSLVSALIVGDGWHSHRKSAAGFTSVSKRLVRDLQYCFLRLGYTSHITLDYKEEGKGMLPQGGKKRKDTIRNYLGLNLTGAKAKKIMEHKDNVYLVRVSEVTETKLSSDFVYDLTIEDFHYYTADHILVHNTEAFRRLYPRERRIPEYNPIPNAFADVEWLPGEGDKSVNFKVGDPFAIPHGDIRLPGAGYETLHPELKGVSPRNYPLIHQLKILGDVAPYSDKYKEALAKVRAMKAHGGLSEEEEQMYKTTLEQVAETKKGKEFQPYKYKERTLTQSEEALARINENIKGGAPEVTGLARLFGSYWETIAHAAETPLEYLTPISPGAKLVHMRTAIEDYERTNLYGKSAAFWQHPIRDFMKPFINSSLHALGWEGIPEDEEERRDIESYFDALKYIKFTRLKRVAETMGNSQLAREFENKRRETLVGVDPYTRNYSHIFRALPRRERDYFNEFVKADAEEREKILQMIPENEKSLIMARWEMEDVANWRKAIKKEAPMSEEEKELAEKQMEALWDKKRTEGYPVDKDLFREYQETRLPHESYADWYRRTRILPELLKERGIPGPDWTGMDPRVRLEDVKLKVVEDIGASPFDYDIWPDDVRAAVRRPYLQEAANQLKSTGGMGIEEIRGKINDLLGANDFTPIVISSKPIYGSTENVIDVTIEQDRTNDIRDIVHKNGIMN